jgi:threonylcarbamoyladenosine tRNA methylthiotransferase MtaB
MKLINKKFFIITLGCRVNILESNNIIEELTKKGAIHTTNINLANFCIINTCCVTNNADKKSKLEIQYACNKKNIKLVVVIGCYSQLNHALITNKKVGIILGTKFKTKLAKIINK